MTQENTRMAKVGDYVRTTKAVGPFDKGTLLVIYEIERPVVSGSIIYHAVCGNGPQWKPPIGTTCVMFDDGFELEEGNVEEGPKPNPFPSTKVDIEKRLSEIYDLNEDLYSERARLQDRLVCMFECGYEEHSEERYKAWKILEDYANCNSTKLDAIEAIVDLVRK